MAIGIYLITELSTSKHYVGLSLNIKRRWNDHKVRFPTSLFSYRILEECTKDQLDEKERFFINEFNSFVPLGFNKTRGGSNKFPCDADSLEKHRKIQNTEEIKKFRSEMLRERWANEETRKTLMEALQSPEAKEKKVRKLKETQATAGYKKNLSEKITESWKDEHKKEERKRKMKAGCNTPEAKKNRSIAQKNRSPATEETRRNMSEAAKNRGPMSDEQKAKLSLAFKGRLLSEKQKAKQKETRRVNKLKRQEQEQEVD